MVKKTVTSKKHTSAITTRTVAVTAIFSALSVALMYLEFSVPIMPGFIKFNFSDLPALITSFAFGPVYGIAVCLVKNMIHLLSTMTGGIGELSNFILSAFFVGTAGLIYKKKKSKKSALIGSVSGAFIMALISIPSNYFIVYPIYANIMPYETIIGMYKTILPCADTLLKALLIFNFPFTFLKGVIVSAITFAIYKKISPLLKK